MQRTSVERACAFLSASLDQLSLRTQGVMLIGMVKILHFQWQSLLRDVQQTIFTAQPQVPVASSAAPTLPTAEPTAFLLPEIQPLGAADLLPIGWATPEAQRRRSSSLGSSTNLSSMVDIPFSGDSDLASLFPIMPAAMPEATAKAARLRVRFDRNLEILKRYEPIAAEKTTAAQLRDRAWKALTTTSLGAPYPPLIDAATNEIETGRGAEHRRSSEVSYSPLPTVFDWSGDSVPLERGRPSVSGEDESERPKIKLHDLLPSTFEEISKIGSKKREAVSELFYAVLDEATKGTIQCRQEGAFGSIFLSAQ